MQSFSKHIPDGSHILDVGGADVNGTYKPIFKNCEYKTLDYENADIIVSDYKWPELTFDAVISGQMLEHDRYFWKTLDNISKIIPDVVILIVPSKGKYHAHPVDCYRFYPDCAEVFAEILGMELVEKVWNEQEYWGDLGMVFK